MTTLESLQEQRKTMITYLLSKVEANDMHGVADAAMDIREIDAQIKLLKELNDEQQVK